MTPNFLVLAGSALIPFFVAFIWFHPKMFGGTTWAEVAGLTPEQIKNPVKRNTTGKSSSSCGPLF